jgi:hypothetical protein
VGLGGTPRMIDFCGAQSSQRTLSPGAVAASPPRSPLGSLDRELSFFESRTCTLIIFRNTETTIHFLY